MSTLLTKREVCEKLSISLSTLNYLMQERLLPYVIVGRHSVRFTLSDLDAYVNNSRNDRR